VTRTLNMSDQTDQCIHVVSTEAETDADSEARGPSLRVHCPPRRNAPNPDHIPRHSGTGPAFELDL